MIKGQCVICSERFLQTSSVSATSCGHVFHDVCLTEWIERDKTCPTCRAKVDPNSMIVPKLFIDTGESSDSNESLDADYVDGLRNANVELQEEIAALRLVVETKQKENDLLAAKAYLQASRRTLAPKLTRLPNLVSQLHIDSQKVVPVERPANANVDAHLQTKSDAKIRTTTMGASKDMDEVIVLDSSSSSSSDDERRQKKSAGLDYSPSSSSYDQRKQKKGAVLDSSSNDQREQKKGHVLESASASWHPSAFSSSSSSSDDND